jgi:hypothetical protein
MPQGLAIRLSSPEKSVSRRSGPEQKNRILAIRELCRISAALRHDLNGGSDFLGFLMLRNEHHGHDALLFSIAIQFPKLAIGPFRPRKAMKNIRFSTLAQANRGPSGRIKDFHDVHDANSC